MKEIGGYFQIETMRGQEYYPGLFKFNLGRTAFTWYIRHTGVKKLYMPCFMCDSMIDAARETGVELLFYHIKRDFTPVTEELPDRVLRDDECILIGNAYGQLEDGQILELKRRYGRILLDFTHAFFQRPPQGVDALVSVRKFLGVTDGAYLQSDLLEDMPDGHDMSHGRLGHILGRYEEPAGKFYQMMLDNAHSYVGAAEMQMAPLTENLLRGIDYDYTAKTRLDNYRVLHELLGDKNGLCTTFGVLKEPAKGPFVYPMYVKKGPAVRKALAKEQIFVPTYWNNVIRDMDPRTVEYDYASNILALQCDQRYDAEDMRREAGEVLKLISCLDKA